MTMFRLELDLWLYFTPLMDEDGDGIKLTRAIELPFAPHPELAIAGREIEGASEPMGFPLKELTWDVEQEVFFAHTSLVECDVPIAAIPKHIGYWIAGGWRLGSYLDSYHGEKTTLGSDDGTEPALPAEDEWDTMREWERSPQRSRPKSFNKVLQAMVRKMVELSNNASTAYAISKTKRFFADSERRRADSPAIKRFFKAKDEFEQMSFDDQYEWSQRIRRRYSRLDGLIPKC